MNSPPRSKIPLLKRGRKRGERGIERNFMVKIKICGITNDQDASRATKLGVDALGFIFAPSPRKTTPEKVRDIVSTIPPFVKTVGVFVDEDPARIEKIMNFCNLDLAQLHGDEPPDVCEELNLRVIKAFQIKDESDLLSMKLYRGHVSAVLLDTFSDHKRGGTGDTFDWSLALRGKELGMPIILSGGLGPDNIGEAISTVRPYAVDVNSGIESSPGEKDQILMERLMESIRRVRGHAK